MGINDVVVTSIYGISSTYPARRAVPFKIFVFLLACSLNEVSILYAIDDVVLVQTVEEFVAGLPTIGPIGTVWCLKSTIGGRARIVYLG